MAGKRELIDTGADKRYVRRDEKGRFTESDDIGRSLSKDVQTKACMGISMSRFEFSGSVPPGLLGGKTVTS